MWGKSQSDIERLLLFREPPAATYTLWQSGNKG